MPCWHFHHGGVRVWQVQVPRYVSALVHIQSSQNLKVNCCLIFLKQEVKTSRTSFVCTFSELSLISHSTFSRAAFHTLIGALGTATPWFFFVEIHRNITQRPTLEDWGGEPEKFGYIGSTYTGWWFEPLWKISVSWDDYSQYMGTYKMFQTTNQDIINFPCYANSLTCYDEFPLKQQTTTTTTTTTATLIIPLHPSHKHDQGDAYDQVGPHGTHDPWGLEPFGFNSCFKAMALKQLLDGSKTLAVVNRVECPIYTGWWLGHPSEKFDSQLGWLETQY